MHKFYFFHFKLLETWVNKNFALWTRDFGIIKSEVELEKVDLPIIPEYHASRGSFTTFSTVLVSYLQPNDSALALDYRTDG